jgi:hypothetical protein
MVRMAGCREHQGTLRPEQIDFALEMGKRASAEYRTR